MKKMKLMTPRELEDYLKETCGLSRGQSALNQYRGQGKGPPFHKLGNRVFYDQDDVDRWLEANLAPSYTISERRKLRVVK